VVWVPFRLTLDCPHWVIGELLPSLEEDEQAEDPSTTGKVADNGDALFPTSGGNSNNSKETSRRRSMLGSLLSGFGGQDTPDSATKSPTNKKSVDKHVSSGSGLDLNGSTDDVDATLGSSSTDSTVKTKSFFKTIYGKNKSDTSTKKSKKTVNFSDKVDVKVMESIPDSPSPPPPPPPPPVRSLKQLGFGEVESASEDTQSPTPDTEDENVDDDNGDDDGDDSDIERRKGSDDSDDDGEAEKRGWGWEAVDDLDSEDEGGGVPVPPSSSSNKQPEEESTPTSTSNAATTVRTSGRRSSVDAIRSAIFSAFRGKASEDGGDTDGANWDDDDHVDTKQQRRGSD
jgi:hypothetical protein